MADPEGQDPDDAGLVFAAHNNHDERCGRPPRLRNTDNPGGARDSPGGCLASRRWQGKRITDHAPRPKAATVPSARRPFTG
jgi:hypothetical protein